jgi:hypothetical protein
MKVIHHFEYSWPDGTTPITLQQWVNTLSTEEQECFRSAEKRQRLLRAQTIDNGTMSIAGPHSYEWQNNIVANINKKYDKEWRDFFDRYIKETGTIFKIREERT